MFINPNWRILTVGDGDLSFSWSLAKHFQPLHLTASVYDSEPELSSKYVLTYFKKLRQMGVEVLTQFDVTSLHSAEQLNAQYDVVIFQFPLIPNLKNKQAFSDLNQRFGDDFSINTLNRRLLREFIKQCLTHYLAKDGARLVYISSKDVKPYIEWNIEHQITRGLPVKYLGCKAFDNSQFPEYKIRNVDRDKYVKDTAGVTYVWSDKGYDNTTLPLQDLTPYRALGSSGCDLCGAGPFVTEVERAAHQASKKHQRMMDFDRQWLKYLSAEHIQTN